MEAEQAANLLEIDVLNSHYGRAHILRDLTLQIAPGAVMVLLGRNGAGKSTVMKSIIGLLRPTSGRIRFRGRDIAGLDSYRIARLGLGYVPEERRIFRELTVMENLDIGRQKPRHERPAWTPDRLFALFPNLGAMRSRPGGRMSGGEQQMLTIARTLMGNPTLVLLDEPSEGLSPLIVEQMAAAIVALKAQGVTVLLAEQNLHFALRVADAAAVIESGQIVWSGTVAALRADTQISARYLAV
jgi:branched-chain amino acid transport system ATP-binding protein